MRKGRSFLLATLFVLILMNGLCIMEIDRLRGYYLEDVAVRQEDYLHVVQTTLQAQSDVRQALIEQFEIVYPTSNISYGVIAEDGEIIYYRNEQGVESLSSMFLEENYEIIDTFSKQSVHVQLQNGIRYIVSYQEISSNEHSYVYALMSSDDGALARTQSLSVFRHLYLFMGMSSIVILIIMFQLVRANSKKEEELKAWAKQEKVNQTTIENLSSDLRLVQKTRIEDTIFGLLVKEDFLDTIIKLNAQQLEQCKIIKIKLLRDEDLCKIYTAAILQRMEVLKCISCEWEKDTFTVLLLNGDPIQLEHLLRYFLETYQSQYHGNIEDVSIDTHNLRSGKDGISTI